MSPHEREKQDQSITITCLSVLRQISFGDEVLKQEAAEPWAKLQSSMWAYSGLLREASTLGLGF
jgi:hypothetical protein